VYRSSSGITQAYLVDYPLSRKSPPDSKRNPHVAQLFDLLRSSHPHALATYLRILATRTGVSFEMAATRHAGTGLNAAPLYDLAIMGQTGGARRLSAAWISRGANSFGLYALASSSQSKKNALMIVQLARAPGSGLTLLHVTFTTPDRRHITVAVTGARIAERSVLSLLLQARLPFTPVSPVPTVPPTPVTAPTPAPSPAPENTNVAASSTSVSLNAPTPSRAATVHALHGAWQPPSVSVGLNASVTWENDDTSSAYSVECAQNLSSAPCPWTSPLPLPAASGGSMPTVSVTFTRPGIFTFRDASHPAMQGQVVVGAPSTP
jgi:plastocyanin/nucleotide-binding universal stress UspA family protein